VLFRSPKAGCDVEALDALPLLSSFNPHPTRRPDATGARAVRRDRDPGFNPHPTRRPDATKPTVQKSKLQIVSTLIRPEGRMRRGGMAGRRESSKGFNPHPTRRPDATCYIRNTRRFNPHPTRRPDATRGNRYYYYSNMVSTLIRPEGRMRQGRLDLLLNDLLFQPSSDPKAGCDNYTKFYLARIVGFNPHPTRRPDATQSSIIAWRSLGVSTLIRPEGRMRPAETSANLSQARFQPSSDPKAGCDMTISKFSGREERFQPSSDPKAGCDACRMSQKP